MVFSTIGVFEVEDDIIEIIKGIGIEIVATIVASAIAGAFWFIIGRRAFIIREGVERIEPLQAMKWMIFCILLAVVIVFPLLELKMIGAIPILLIFSFFTLD